MRRKNKSLSLHRNSAESRVAKKRIPQKGAVVQLVRIHACHAWGRGFESRPHRQKSLENLRGFFMYILEMSCFARPATGDIRVAVACAGIASSCPSASFEICWKVPGHWSRNFFMPEFENLQGFIPGMGFIPMPGMFFLIIGL